MTPHSTRIQALADVASDWRDPDHPPRREAVENTLEAPNRWTEQALAHILNRWMHRLTPEKLSDWIGREGVTPSSVGVLHGSSEPLCGFRDALATWLLGHSYVGRLSEASPSLLASFAEEVRDRCPAIHLEFDDEEALLERVDALLVYSDPPNPSEVDCEAHGIPEERCLVRSPVYSIAVVDGHESEEEMERMVEDMLLLDGGGRRRVTILWAPRNHPPDPYLEAMARFRGVYPVHPETPGTLKMQQAFLEARDEPHAYAEGLEFLVSRGKPEPQRPGHVRWSEYDELDDVETWLGNHEEDVYSIVARSHLHDQLPDHRHVRTPGGIHVPPLDDHEGRELMSFLKR